MNKNKKIKLNKNILIFFCLFSILILFLSSCSDKYNSNNIEVIGIENNNQNNNEENVVNINGGFEDRNSGIDGDIQDGVDSGIDGEGDFDDSIDGDINGDGDNGADGDDIDDSGIKEEGDIKDGILNKNAAGSEIISSRIKLKGNEKYYEFSCINTGYATLYKLSKNDKLYKNKTITINAGHGVPGGSKEKTYSHPDMSPKIGNGTNKDGDIMSFAISEGMTFNDGKKEAEVNLEVAKKLREILLDNGYNVLMIREDNNSKLDNISRTILANNYSDIHLSIHFDSTNFDKGAFVLTPLQTKQYLEMEPVKSFFEEDNRLADAIIEGFENDNIKIWKTGRMGMDLTQISYSTIPSLDLELGDKGTELNDKKIAEYAKSIFHGINNYFGKEE